MRQFAIQTEVGLIFEEHRGRFVCRRNVTHEFLAVRAICARNVATDVRNFGTSLRLRAERRERML